MSGGDCDHMKRPEIGERVLWYGVIAKIDRNNKTLATIERAHESPGWGVPETPFKFEHLTWNEARALWMVKL